MVSALKPCKACKQQVAYNAKVCPHCGAKDPGITSTNKFMGFVGLVVVVAVLGYACSPNEKNIQQAAEMDAACMKDLQCLGDKGTIAAGMLCPMEIEQHAKGAVKWTDGTLEPKFSAFRWKDQNAGIVTHVGDKVQFQNGFGAYVNIAYSCDLDMKQNPPVVLHVTAREGRL